MNNNFLNGHNYNKVITMYYVNTLFFYSVLGFILESTIYKINKAKRYSGIFYGPITEVYGFGVLALLLVKKYLLDKIHWNKYLKLIFTFIISWITLTLIEYIGGNVLKLLFNINMWDYTNKPYNFGKYICLELSLIWGLLGTLYIYYIKDFFDKFLNTIPKKVSITLIIINIIDTLLVLINKIP